MTLTFELTAPFGLGLSRYNRVKEVFEGSAAEVGIEVGDGIVEVDGVFARRHDVGA